MYESEIRTILFDIAPEFYTVDTDELAKIDRMIGYAQTEMNESIWGSKYKIGSAYLVAHRLKLSALSNAIASASATSSGIITKEKLGDQEITYADVSKSGGYSSTFYGTQYENLKKSLAVFGRVLGA